jgi:threonine/homoserine/homoserine lactone efflux protein
MHPGFLIKAFFIGLAIAAPVGPIGVLCIRRTLAEGRLIGFLSGLGAATADMCYGAIAAFGLTAAQDVLVRQQFWLRLIGGLFLIYLGVRTFIAKPAEHAAFGETKLGWLPAYLSTFGLTLTNPATIISFTAIFAGLGLGEADGSIVSAASMVMGVLFGSAAWWITLSSVVGVFRQRFTLSWMGWVNRLAGVMICGFGAFALLLR